MTTELNQTERLQKLCDRLAGLLMGSKRAQKIVNREDWANHYPTVEHDDNCRLRFDGGLVESGDPSLSDYANVDDEAMCLKSECLHKGGHYLGPKHLPA